MMRAGIELRMPFMLSSSETQVLCTCGPSSPLILNTNSSSMSLQWNAPLQPDYVITAYTLHHRVPSLKSQSEMWGTSFDGRGLATFSGHMFLCGFINQPTVQFHTYNPSGILFYQINSVMTDFLGVKLHGGLPCLIFDVSCRWIQQYQNLQRWSVAHCELQNSLVMLSLYVSASVVQSPPVTSVMARARDNLYIISAPALDGFDAVSVQNVGSTYIIVSWDLPTDSNGILIRLQWYSGGCPAPYCDQLQHHRPPSLHFVHVLQSRPQALHSSWNVVLGVISAAASLPRYIVYTSIT
eukprot:Em0011g257a